MKSLYNIQEVLDAFYNHVLAQIYLYSVLLSLSAAVDSFEVVDHYQQCLLKYEILPAMKCKSVMEQTLTP